MYPRVPWELVADPLESVQHTLGTTAKKVLFPSNSLKMGRLCYICNSSQKNAANK
jgi:hypothetical protein